jgi:hypothetical protein
MMRFIKINSGKKVKMRDDYTTTIISRPPGNQSNPAEAKQHFRPDRAQGPLPDFVFYFLRFLWPILRTPYSSLRFAAGSGNKGTGEAGFGDPALHCPCGMHQRWGPRWPCFAGLMAPPPLDQAKPSKF